MTRQITEVAAPEIDLDRKIQVNVRLANYGSSADAQAIVTLLDAYACDPTGGGEPLSDFVKQNLVTQLSLRPHACSVLAWDAGHAVGLINCIEGFSTFACLPLVNVHDAFVLSSHRGLGVGRLMFNFVEVIARERGACKLTLEVLSGNAPARSLYQKLGFADYQLDPGMGSACFMQKWLKT
jgi:ribosomal protein S18 acetylase RimI-like enzyme